MFQKQLYRYCADRKHTLDRFCLARAMQFQRMSTKLQTPCKRNPLFSCTSEAQHQRVSQKTYNNLCFAETSWKHRSVLPLHTRQVLRSCGLSLSTQVFHLTSSFEVNLKQQHEQLLNLGGQLS